ncbi:hypothetical protein BWD42_21620 [Sphingobacterium sp. CZ-UAM]|uniref:MerR family transcriptional regulator n=1 Tax=Sphingobacterium sp. CZ-UAM TaxID=1933868 RepID=UPI0009868933|nr:MerR family transcriptional regulator [Sphingobacterium sp. CZ-UAM]OOG16337.1 hypothetical protein BWD42_21620 [Sphingobacterium sp. CZ-UAM]
MRKYQITNKNRTTDSNLLQALHLLFMEVQQLKKTLQDAIPKENAEVEIRDTEFVKDTVGVSDRTLLRYQNLGLIEVYRRDKSGRKYFRLDDIQRLKRYLSP